MNFNKFINIVIALILSAILGLVQFLSGGHDGVEYNVVFNDCGSIVEYGFLNSKIGDVDLELNSIDKAQVVVSSTPMQIEELASSTELFSPIVAMFPADITKVADKVFAVEHYNQGNVAYYYDCIEIFNAVLESENGDIDLYKLGLLKSEKNSIRRVAIPGKNSNIRRDIVNYIIYLLTDGNMVTEANAKDVKAKLSNIISKVDSVADIINTCEDGKHIGFIPEYKIYEETSNNSYIPVYTNNAYTKPLYIYVKNSMDEYYVSQFLDGLNGGSYVLSNTGFRNSAVPYKDQYKKNIESIYGKFGIKQDNLESLLGSSYWK